MRIPGVLQRIAVCTLLAAPIVVYCSWRQQLAWIAALLAAYAALMLWVPVPGIGAGVLEPGKDFGAYIDRLLLGKHLWVQSKTWDPEGLLQHHAGAVQPADRRAGRALAAVEQRRAAEQTVWMLLAGLVLLALGSILDAILMPINKSLWTPSFCLLMSGWALLAFAAFTGCSTATAMRRCARGAAALEQPFVIYGMNALFIFALSGLIAKMLGFIKFTSRRQRC